MGSDDAPQSEVELLYRLFRAALESASPALCVPPALPRATPGRTVVVGGGKAAASMAHAVEEHWDGPLSGLVVTRHGHTTPCSRVTVREGGHPLPDQKGVAACREMLGHLDDLGEDDLVLCLISGGGSSLFSLPPDSVPLADVRSVFDQLLRSGANISQINCVRRHMSLLAGGRLAKLALPAKLVTLAISDVPGDDPSAIASGPTVPCMSTPGEALDVLRKFDVAIPSSILDWLGSAESEGIGPGSLDFGDFHIIASSQHALEAAAEVARSANCTPVILGSAIEGEAREVAKVHAGIALQVRKYGEPASAPCILLSGGETSVTVTGDGRGGRNSAFLLSLTIALNGEPGVFALAADTDGIDGTEENAGAVSTPQTQQKARMLGIDPEQCLANNDSYGFFEALDSLVVTGPTLTNVNDFRAILVDRSDQGAH